MFMSRWTTPTCSIVDVSTVTTLCSVTSAAIRAGTRPHCCRNGTKRGPRLTAKARASTLRPITQTVA